MKPNSVLIAASLLSLVLLTLHVTDDIVRGISNAEPAKTALIVLVVFLYGTVAVPERRSGHVIMLLIGVFAAAMPVLHMRGNGINPELLKSSGAFIFVWALLALGATSLFAVTLSTIELWKLRTTN